MIRVLIESPYAARPEIASHEDRVAEVESNVDYARRCMADCLRRGEAPFASHLLYPQVLDDLHPAQRRQGIEAGLAWGKHADKTVVYTDRGISPGMQLGIDRAIHEDRPVEYRTLADAAK